MLLFSYDLLSGDCELLLGDDIALKMCEIRKVKISNMAVALCVCIYSN